MSRTASQVDGNAAAIQNARATPGAAKTAPVESGSVASPEKEGDVPPEFGGVDFKNFSYPTTLRKRDIRLKDGTYEYPDPDSGGDTFDWDGVDFVDVTGDGKKDAIVRLHRVTCGASCDGGSYLLYVYSPGRNKPSLYWRIETGSLGYGCGLKTLNIKGHEMTLELFNKCRFEGVYPTREPVAEDEVGKFGATAYTRFSFVSDGEKVVLKDRDIFPYPQGDVRNYNAEISIGDD